MGRLHFLRNLRLNSNDLTGEIPAELADSQFLEVLRLDNNMLEGEIPTALADLTGLREIRLGGTNTLEGCVPNALEEVDRNDVDTLDLPLCEVEQPAEDSTGEEEPDTSEQ